jgi:predicted nucleic acid-binding protein
MNAVDANVLFYARDPRDARKQQIAIALIDSMADGALLWQVACEYLSASRKLESFGYEPEHAVADIAELRQGWTILLPKWATLDRAELLRKRYSLSFWDALLIAGCLEADVRTLYSEDFDAYGRIDSLELVNPFR